MAEYKNGFNAFGGMPVDSSRRSPELHTGRAVYINDDEYSDEPNYKNKADSIVREGYHKEAPFEAPEIVVPEPIIPSGTKSITENGTYDVTQFAKAEVNVAGGGGSSDFSTAEVTVSVLGDHLASESAMYCAYVGDDNVLYGDPLYLEDFMEESLPIQIVMLNGLSKVFLHVVVTGGTQYTATVDVSGGIEKIYDNELNITGDGAIMISIISRT